MTDRRKPPPRRICVTHDLWFAGKRFHVSVGYDPTEQNMRPREIFIHGAKPGSDAHSVIADQSVLLSYLLQHDIDLDAMAASMLRDEDGNPASMLGAVADLIKASTK